MRTQERLTIANCCCLQSATIDCIPRHRLAGEGHPLELFPMRPTERDVSHHEVPFCKLIIDRDAQIREGTAEQAEWLFDAFGVRREPWRQLFVFDQIGGHELIDGRKHSLVDDLLYEPAIEGLVVFVCRGASSVLVHPSPYWAAGITPSCWRKPSSSLPDQCSTIFPSVS